MQNIRPTEQENLLELGLGVLELCLERVDALLQLAQLLIVRLRGSALLLRWSESKETFEKGKRERHRRRDKLKEREKLHLMVAQDSNLPICSIVR